MKKFLTLTLVFILSLPFVAEADHLDVLNKHNSVGGTFSMRILNLGEVISTYTEEIDERTLRKSLLIRYHDGHDGNQRKIYWCYVFRSYDYEMDTSSSNASCYLVDYYDN